MVAPLVETLLLHVMRRRAATVPIPRPTRLVSQPRAVDSVGFVAERTSVLLERPGAGLEALGAGSLVLPALLGPGAATYVVVSHDPVDVWLRIGPFETLDGRLVQQVELRLTVSLQNSPSGLRELAEDPVAQLPVSTGGTSGAGGTDGSDRGRLGRLGDVVLDRLAGEVSDRTADAVRRRTLAELTGLSLGVLLDSALPTTFLAGLVERSDLEVLDVDWPTEGRGLSAALTPVPVVATGPGTVAR